jgi:hypothetical protein
MGAIPPPQDNFQVIKSSFSYFVLPANLPLLSDGCSTAIDVFSHSGEIRIFVSIIRNVIFFTSKEQEHLVS